RASPQSPGSRSPARRCRGSRSAASDDNEDPSGCGSLTASRVLLRPLPSSRLRLRARWTPRTTPTPATATNRLRLRTRGRSRRLLPRHLLGNRLWWATGTTGAPCPTSPATAATAAVLRWLRRWRRNAAEQRLNRGADFLLHQVPDHRHEAWLSRHQSSLPVLFPAADTRKIGERQGFAG